MHVTYANHYANHYKSNGFADLRETWHIAPLDLYDHVCYRSRNDAAMVKSVPDMGWVTESDNRSTNQMRG